MPSAKVMSRSSRNTVHSTDRYRHRRSDESSHSHSLSTSRRASVGNLAQMALPRAMLEHIRIEFTKAIVPSNKLSGVRYVMRVTNRALDRSWEMVRPFREFDELKDQLLASLKHGHLCESNCPFLYMHITHSFPRRHFFRSRMPSVIANRLTELAEFMNGMLRVCKTTKGECKAATEALPQALYDFLYQGISLEIQPLRRTMNASTLEESDENNESSGNQLESPLNRLSLDNQQSANYSSGGCDAKICPLCEVDLTGHLDALNSVTTLECGHRFHDECILAKLNESLRCPVCKKRQHV